MSDHRMNVDWSGGSSPDYSLACTAGPEALCRADWDCECEEFMAHGIDEKGPWHELANGYMTNEELSAERETGVRPRHYGKPGGECGMALWVNESGVAEELGNGALSIPVNVTWDGDDWLWEVL